MASTTRLANRSLSELVGELFGVTPGEAVATGTLQLAMQDMLHLCSSVDIESILYHWLTGHQEIVTSLAPFQPLSFIIHPGARFYGNGGNVLVENSNAKTDAHLSTKRPVHGHSRANFQFVLPQKIC